MKEQILKYLKKRRDYIINLMQKHFEKTRDIDSAMLEVFFTYNAIISDITNNRLDE